jgi:hypothetical protein
MGQAGHGAAWLGLARHGKARVLRHMVAVPQIVKAWPGKVRQGTARQGKGASAQKTVDTYSKTR